MSGHDCIYFSTSNRSWIWCASITKVDLQWEPKKYITTWPDGDHLLLLPSPILFKTLFGELWFCFLSQPWKSTGKPLCDGWPARATRHGMSFWGYGAICCYSPPQDYLKHCLGNYRFVFYFKPGKALRDHYVTGGPRGPPVTV